MRSTSFLRPAFLVALLAAGVGPVAASPTWTQVAPAAFACSSGYIPVPAFTLPSGTKVSQFCVMKYNAKKNPSTAGDRSIGGVGGALPISVAAGLPWAGLTAQDARSACAATGAHLITENQWLSLAHQVTSVASNWTGGAVGNGVLYSGHNDNLPPNSLAASPDDNDGYYGTGDSAVAPGDGAFAAFPSNLPGASQGQRRTLSLPNGHVIWDLSGNIWQYVAQTIPVASRYHGGGAGWMSYNSVEGAVPWASNVPLDKRPPNGYNAAQGMGRYLDGISAAGASNSFSEAPDYCGVNDCAPVAAFLRGGGWDQGQYAGVFSLHLRNGRSVAGGLYQGFRCTR